MKYKKIIFRNLNFIPASHEKKDDPGVVKKILMKSEDFPMNIKIQMINWARLFMGRSFISHYHEDMDELFIITCGKVKIIINGHDDILESGDAIYIPQGSIHKMDNVSNSDVDYIAIGLSRNKGGKTVITE